MSYYNNSDYRGSSAQHDPSNNTGYNQHQQYSGRAAMQSGGADSKGQQYALEPRSSGDHQSQQYYQQQQRYAGDVQPQQQYQQRYSGEAQAQQAQQYAAWHYHQQQQLRYPAQQHPQQQPPTYPPPSYAYTSYANYSQPPPAMPPNGYYHPGNYPQPPAPNQLYHQQQQPGNLPQPPPPYPQQPASAKPTGNSPDARAQVQPVENTSQAKAVPPAPEAKEVKKQPIVVGKRRGGKILPTGVVKKAKAEAVDEGRKDPWTQYMSEVRKYKEQSCSDDQKNRPLVK